MSHLIGHVNGEDIFADESKRHRFWVYKRDDWDPEHWWEKLVYLGGDEYHRRTIVLPWITGYLVVALWQFEDEDGTCSVCNEFREEGSQ